ncbi:MAG: PilZ domain-containing protein [Deltaproteobacteria bacterium]
MSNQERRVNERVTVEFKVSYIHDGDYLISYSRDISADGMFIYTEDPPGIGDRPHVTFTVNGREISLQAEVIWVNTSKSSKDCGMGVRFIKPPARLRKEILSMVKKVAVFPAD